MNRFEERIAYWWDMASRHVDAPTEITVEERADAGDGGRHYAYCEVDGPNIIIAYSPGILDLPQKHIDGIALHELGHAIDFSYSQRYLDKMFGVKLDSDPEHRADEIIELLLGETIQYDRPNYVQCVGDTCMGGSRPRGLR